MSLEPMKAQGKGEGPAPNLERRSGKATMERNTGRECARCESLKRRNTGQAKRGTVRKR